MPGKPIPKLSTKKPYSNIRKWIYEKNKRYVPNPMKPSKFKTTKEKISDFNKLGKILKETHSPSGKINKLIDEVNDLIKRVTVNETDITILETRLDTSDSIQKLQSVKGHLHPFTGTGAVLPSTSKKGGHIQKLQSGGGKFTRPVINKKKIERAFAADKNAMSVNDPLTNLQKKESLIDEIKRLQNQNSG
tara:strand:+ start:178 stop:747 length:570 start_codon:yes stop_codon:yes gene_type:complete